MQISGSSDSPTVAAVIGTNSNGDAIIGFGKGSGRGVIGVSDSHTGVEGNSTTGSAMWAISQTGPGVTALSDSAPAVYGHSKTQSGLVGESDTFDAITGIAHTPTAAAIAGHNPSGVAGFFEGNVTVTGNISVVGDVLLTGADCAEEFELAALDAAEPGVVMVMNEEGELTASYQPYDRKVIGVISGAGTYRPAIVMDRGKPGHRAAVALIGKVYCMVDADIAPVEIGDLMTTSSTAGHAMKAADPDRAFGAVFGKALKSLNTGKALLPVLVTLQ